ncbi:hypothetical protein HELRODRAFT_76370, partial [Helobdella robusta]|uniref:Uncharacterized protein n=1 Tax=Helobdella robusta TaxID=6412 RepID=T1G2J1_HELRO
GVYVSWRCPNQKWDCQRVASFSKCFCGHSLQQHDSGSRTLCKYPNCSCKHFAWVPSNPEEVGEFWLRRRKDFKENQWRAKCKCKHSHEEHDANGNHKCTKCSCPCFQSNFLCAACDRRWEEHETFFENVSERRENGLATGIYFLPFSEIPSLRNMVLTGKDDGDVSYIKLQSKLNALTATAADSKKVNAATKNTSLSTTMMTS